MSRIKISWHFFWDELSVSTFWLIRALFSWMLRRLKKLIAWNCWTNPPAPKVPRHDSLGAGPLDSNNFTGTVWAGGGISEPNRALKSARDSSNLHILHIGTTSSKFIQIHRFDPTCPQHGLNLEPNLVNLDPTCPTWTHLAQTWPFEHVWEQLRPKLKPTWLQNGGHCPNTKSSTAFSLLFSGFFGIEAAHWASRFQLLLVSMVCVKPNLRQTVLSCAMLGPSWAEVGPKLEICRSNWREGGTWLKYLT